MWSRSGLQTALLSLVALGACAPQDRASSGVETARTVELVTGDRVTLPANRGAPIIAPGPGRDRVGFITMRHDERIFVIPRDAIAPGGRFDRAAFDVTLQAGVLGPAPVVAADAPMCALTMRGRGRDGNPDLKLLFLIDRANRVDRGDVVAGDTTVQVPCGEYLLSSLSHDTSLTYPRLTLDRDMTIELDDRVAQPVELAVPGVDLEIRGSEVGIWALSERWLISILSDEQTYTAQLGPEAPAAEFRASMIVDAVPRDASDDEETYHFARFERGRAMSGWRETIARHAFATIDASHVGLDVDHFDRYVSPWFVDNVFAWPWTFRLYHRYGPRAHRTEYVYGHDVVWETLLARWIDTAGGGAFIDQVDQFRTYRPGTRYVERWNRAPYGPSFAEVNHASSATRSGDALTLMPSLFSDADLLSPSRSSDGLVSSDYAALYRDDALIAQNDDIGTVWIGAAVGPAPASYRYEARATRNLADEAGASLAPLSTHLDATWTFASAAGDAERLPLPTVRFVPVLDDDNRAGKVLVLPVEVERPPGAAQPAITNIAVEISYDDGKSWAKLPGAKLGDRWLGVVVHPAGAQFASLRGSARDADGRTNEVTIIRAYRL